jgi:hypothetical protein
MECQEKNWLQRFLEAFDSQYAPLAFSSDLHAAYATHYGVGYPEDDDECYRDALIEALNTLIDPIENRERFAWLVRWCFSVLGVGRNREDLIKELDCRLLSGYAFDQFEQMKLYWRKLARDADRIKLEKDPELIAAKRAVKKAEQEKKVAEHVLRKKLTDWRYHEYEPIWGEEMSVTKFIDRLKSDGRLMSWEDFVNGLTPKFDGQPTALKDQLARLSKKPAIYWYPGSGMDFKPLILDTPNNPTGRRLFRVSDPDHSADPILFWMNDHGSYLATEPQSKTLKADYSWSGDDDDFFSENRQYERWAKYGARLEIAQSREDYLFQNITPVTLFTVTVRNENQESKNRPKEGDTYLALFSHTASHALFEELLFPLRLNVVCTILAAQGGFSGQLRGFEQYRDIPKLLRKCEDELGPVDIYLLDDQAHDGVKKRPNSPYIRHYEYIGGPVRIGWYPCRAFGRPGLSYTLQRKSS